MSTPAARQIQPVQIAQPAGGQHHGLGGERLDAIIQFVGQCQVFTPAVDALQPADAGDDVDAAPFKGLAHRLGHQAVFDGQDARGHVQYGYLRTRRH